MKKLALAFSFLFLTALAGFADPAARLDFDGDGKSDLVNYNGNGIWLFDYSLYGWDTYYGPTDYWTYAYVSTPQSAAADYDGDGLADLGYLDASGDWGIDYGSNGIQYPFDAEDLINYYNDGWGNDSCKPMPYDYDGDGSADIAVYCNDAYSFSTWDIDYSSNGFNGIDYNGGGWYTGDHQAVPADYDGDGMVDIAIKDDASGWWTIDYASNGFGYWDDYYAGWGDADYLAAPADFDGDGSADLAVMYRAGYATWWIDYASNGFTDYYYNADEYHTPFGTVGEKPIPGDYDGDGKADIAAKSDYYEAIVIDYSGNTFGSGDEWLSGWGDATMQALRKSKPAAQAKSELTQRLGMVTFSFGLTKAVKASVKVYGLDGKQVATLFDGRLDAGANRLTWDKKELTQKGLKRGTYFLRLEAGEYHTSKRLALVD
jgi:hypothetical protein